MTWAENHGIVAEGWCSTGLDVSGNGSGWSKHLSLQRSLTMVFSSLFVEIFKGNTNDPGQ